MREHVHWGFFDFLFAGISAVVFIKALHLIAIGASDRFPAVTQVLGGVLNTGTVTTRNEASN